MLDFVSPIPENIGDYWETGTKKCFFKGVHLKEKPDLRLIANSKESESPQMEIEGEEGELVGEGVTSTLKSIIDKIIRAKGAVEAVDFLITGPVGTAVANLIQKNIVRNPLARPKFEGERHMVLTSAWGPVIASFAGPGTRIISRLKRSDRGVDPDKNGSFIRSLDQAARKHDILYSLARDMNQIRVADEIFLKDVNKSSQPDIIKKMLKSLFKLKMFGENINIPGIPGSELHGKKLKNADINFLLEKLIETNVSLGKPELDGLVKVVNIKTTGGSSTFDGFQPTGNGMKQKAKGLHLPGSGLKLPGAPPRRVGGKFATKKTDRQVRMTDPTGRLELPVQRLLSGLNKSQKKGSGTILVPDSTNVRDETMGIQSVGVKSDSKSGGQALVLGSLLLGELIPVIIKAIKKKKKKGKRSKGSSSKKRGKK